MKLSGRIIKAILFYIFAQFITVSYIVSFSNHQNKRILALMTLFYLIIWIISIALIFLSVSDMVKENIQLKEIEKNERKIKYISSFSNLLKLQNTKVRRLYHDLANHKVVLDELEKDGFVEKRLTYAKEVKENYQEKEAYICEDIVINEIFNIYQEEFKKRGYTLSIDYKECTEAKQLVPDILMVMDKINQLNEDVLLRFEDHLVYTSTPVQTDFLSKLSMIVEKI